MWHDYGLLALFTVHRSDRRGRFTVQWEGERAKRQWTTHTNTYTHTEYVTQMTVAPDETQVLRGHSQTDETLLMVTEKWPIARSHADRAQMPVSHWLLGLKSCLHEWRAEWVDRSRSRCSVCNPAGCFRLVFMNWSKAVISIIVIIYDELPLVALNYCVLEPVAATLLLSDQPFCQHQSLDNECIFVFGDAGTEATNCDTFRYKWI